MPSFDDLHPYLADLAAQDKFSGVVRITRGDAEVWSGAYGYASRAWQVPNSLDMRFDTASITKLFTAVAALQLVDQGRLALDTRIEQLGLKGTTLSPEITVHQLLTHTSGIADDADEESGESYEALWLARSNYLVTTTADFLPGFIHKPANFAPGQGCRYCNVGYILLGLLIEQASGLVYRDYVRQHIFAAAGMAHSGFFAMHQVQPNVAEGADPIRGEDGAITGWKRNIYSYPPIGSPDGGAHVTAADLARFLRQVQAGRLLSPALTEAMLTPQARHSTQDGLEEWAGYGLWFKRNATGRVVSYEKDGINAGVSGMLRHYPEHGLTVVVLSNMEEGAWAPVREVHRRVVG